LHEAGHRISLEGEQSLIAVRASGAEADFAYGKQHLHIGCAISRFQIEDVLVGRRCPEHRFLARSYDASQVIGH